MYDNIQRPKGQDNKGEENPVPDVEVSETVLKGDVGCIIILDSHFFLSVFM